MNYEAVVIPPNSFFWLWLLLTSTRCVSDPYLFFPFTDFEGVTFHSHLLQASHNYHHFMILTILYKWYPTVSFCDLLHFMYTIFIHNVPYCRIPSSEANTSLYLYAIFCLSINLLMDMGFFHILLLSGCYEHGCTNMFLRPCFQFFWT